MKPGIVRSTLFSYVLRLHTDPDNGAVINAQTPDLPRQRPRLICTVAGAMPAISISQFEDFNTLINHDQPAEL